MTEDLLERATRALREQHGAEPNSDRAAFMRARVLSQAKRSSKLRPQGIWQWAAVVSLGFFVSTAMAQVIAVQLPKLIEALRHEPADEAKAKKTKSVRPVKPAQPKAAAPVVQEPAAPSIIEEVPSQDAAMAPGPVTAAPAAASGEAAPAPATRAPSAPAVAAAASGEAAPAPAAPVPAVAAPSPRRLKRAAPRRALSAYIPAQPSAPPPMAAEPEPRHAPVAEAPEERASSPQPKAAAPVAEGPEERASSPQPKAAAPVGEAREERVASPQPKAAAPESAELALFRRAQALHVAHDPRAIAAWDAFLRVAGSSVLAPEARYNRALGLVRASRFDEARRALKPFAAGAYGSYRKQEAQALIARLPE